LKREHFHRFSYLSSIRIAINIDEDTLEKAMIVTGEPKKRTSHHKGSHRIHSAENGSQVRQHGQGRPIRALTSHQPPKIWRKVVKNYAKLRPESHTLPSNDIMITTIVLEKEAAIFAHDKHFPIMAKVLKVHLYRPGYNGNFNPDY
jgi:hypothetical protein